MKKTTVEDAWSAKKAKLDDLSQEQTQADIQLVETQRALAKAQSAHAAAQARKTTAEKKLSSFRAQLGGE